MLELSTGRIMIDEIDIGTAARHLVRERLISVPQTAFFIPGTVRFNVNPARTASDDEIIAALRKARIWDFIQEQGGLDVELKQQTFSAGQLQLVSLARALLRPGAVLVLDEAYQR